MSEKTSSMPDKSTQRWPRKRIIVYSLWITFKVLLIMLLSITSETTQFVYAGF